MSAAAPSTESYLYTLRNAIPMAEKPGYRSILHYLDNPLKTLKTRREIIYYAINQHMVDFRTPKGADDINALIDALIANESTFLTLENAVVAERITKKLYPSPSGGDRRRRSTHGRRRTGKHKRKTHRRRATHRSRKH